MNWETILAIITHPVVIAIVTGVAGIAITGFAKYRKAFNSLVDIPRAVLKARGKKSPGGKDITTEEYAKIGKEIVEFIEHSAPLFKKVR